MSREATFAWAARLAVAIALVAAVALGRHEAAAQPPGGEAKPDPEAILKNIVVAATGERRPLPKIAVYPSLASDPEDVTIRNVVARDLDLCGEFEVLPDSAAPDKWFLKEGVDVAAWKKTGAEAVVRVSGKKLPDGRVQLGGLAYFTNEGDKPVFDKRIVVPAGDVRVESHRVADLLIGALTGTPGGFTSQMTFVMGIGRSRRVYVIDADGHDAHAVSGDDEVALAPAFGPGHRLYYAASVRHDAYKILSPGVAEPVSVRPPGSVYGLAFSRDGRVAVSIAVGPRIHLFTGPSLAELSKASDNPMALHPAFSPSGKVAFAGQGKWSAQQIFVDGKPVSPAGLAASAPDFCRHPDGVRLVFAVGAGKILDLVATGETGGSLVRLTQGRGGNTYPACSPDGRLVAFFSTRTSDEGPGLYMMRVDGTRPKRVSPLLGDSLRWARRPDPAAAKK
jgi:TolB protein